MIVCICRRVSDDQIRRAAAAGATTLEHLKVELGVATGCGRCGECACEVLEAAKDEAPIHAGARRTIRIVEASGHP